MSEVTGARHQMLDVSVAVPPPQAGSKCYDDDGRLKRTGMYDFLFSDGSNPNL